MTVRTRAQLNGDADTYLPDNTAGEISPADVRQRVKDLADSALFDEDVGTAAVADASDFATAAQGAKADTAVQPARTISAGTGLTGGGSLAADRTLALSSGSISSLLLADTAVQPDDLAEVATSGAYGDLSGTPTLGTAASKDTGTASGNVPVLDGSGKLASSVLPQSLGTGDSPQFAGLNVGHASDTTVARAAAGVLSVEGNVVPSPASQASGDILYRGASSWLRLAKGTAGQVLTMNAGATAPEWGDASGGGQPTPSSSILPVGATAFLRYNSATSVADGATASGSNLRLPIASPAGSLLTTAIGAIQTGTWKNISGASLKADDAQFGQWVRVL